MQARILDNMMHSWQLLIDTIFPPTEHELLLRKYDLDDFRNYLNIEKDQNVICLSSYQLPAIKAAVASAKFEQSYRASKLLGAMVTAWLASLPPRKTLIIPIPLSPVRFRERGFNQVERVISYAKNLPYEATISTSCISRQRHTKPQTSLDRKDRLFNLKGAFKVNEGRLAKHREIKRVIICDDVMTTGATLNEARTTFAPHLPLGAEIICVAWVH